MFASMASISICQPLHWRLRPCSQTCKDSRGQIQNWRYLWHITAVANSNGVIELIRWDLKVSVPNQLQDGLSSTCIWFFLWVVFKCTSVLLFVLWRYNPSPTLDIPKSSALFFSVEWSHLQIMDSSGIWLALSTESSTCFKIFQLIVNFPFYFG